MVEQIKFLVVVIRTEDVSMSGSLIFVNDSGCEVIDWSVGRALACKHSNLESGKSQFVP